MGKTVLVVEGGAMRGIYTAGVLESFMEEGFDPFDLYIGVSAGTCNISSYLARQFERNYRTYVGLMSQKEFINPWRFLWGGNLYDLDWLWEENQKINAIDYEKAYNYLKESAKAFQVVLTSLETGEATYFYPTPDNWMDSLKASSAFPVFYRGGCELEGKTYVDGGLSDPLPVQHAINCGATTIVVLRTRGKDYIKEKEIKNFIGSKIFRKYPRVAKLVSDHPDIYNQSVELINSPPENVKIIEVAPDAALKLSTSTRNRTKLDKAHTEGKSDGKIAIAHIAKILEEKCKP